MRAISISTRLLVIILLGIYVCCTTRSALRLEKLSSVTSSGNFLSAAATIRANRGWYGKNSEFLYYMDLGMLYHFAGMFDTSTFYLSRAVQINDDLFTRSITNEAASILINDNVRPYRSKPYELVMMHQILALNYLARGDFEEALVESRQAQLKFNEWERKDPRGLKYSSDGMFHYLSSIAYEGVGQDDDAMISLYHSIRAYISGPVALADELRNYAYYKLIQNDREADVRQLGIVANAPQDKVVGLSKNQTEIIFIGYAGKGPALGEESWWGTYIMDGLLVLHYKGSDGKEETVTMHAPALPAAEYEKASKGRKTKSGTTFHIKFAMPKLITYPSQTSYFTIKHPSLPSPVKSIVINDYDKLAAKNLEDSRTTTITRTVIRVVLRTIAAQKTKSELSGDNPLLNLIVNIGTDVLTDQLEKADTRTCFLIPKTVHLVRIPVTPGIHSIEVAALNNSGAVIGNHTFTNIEVKKGKKTFIFYPSLM